MWPFGYAQDKLRLVPRLLGSRAEFKFGYYFVKFYQH